MEKVEIFDTTGLEGERLGQYIAVRRKAVRTVNGNKFIIAIYGAYNAMGIIGPEHNGIVVLNETKMAVITDRHMPAETGEHGATSEQVAEFTRLVNLPGVSLLRALRAMERFRGEETLGQRTAS